jgi:hypothetical protein
MNALLTLLLLAVSVQPDHAVLRDGCDADADTIATLSAGAPVTIRYALSGTATPCYKVSVEDRGKTIEGFLPGDALKGLEDFQQGLQDASWLEVPKVMDAVRNAAASASLKPDAASAAIVNRAADLIQAGQPAKALALLEAQPQTSKDADILALAGVAAWRSDDAKKALDYWQASMAIHPNDAIRGLYQRVERETNADRSTEKLAGVRVILRYDPVSIPIETARAMLGTLDHEYARISGELGCNREERIVAIAQSEQAYRKATDSAEWSGGQYDGRIRVPLTSGQGIDANVIRALSHETTHACLDMLGTWPSWFKEGLAQKMSGDTVSPALRQKLAAWAQNGKLPRLSNLSQDWSRLDTEHATAAYGLSLAAIELFYQDNGVIGLRNLLHDPDRLPAVTADLDRRLGL